MTGIDDIIKLFVNFNKHTKLTFYSYIFKVVLTAFDPVR